MKKHPLQGFSLRSTALWLSVTYAVLGGSWIVYSDNLLMLLIDDPTRIAHLQTYKGLLYIAVTAPLLYLVASRAPGPLGFQSGRTGGEQRVRILGGMFAALMVATIIANLVFSLTTARQEVLAKAENATASLAHLLQEQTAASINAVDLALALTARSIEMVPGQGAAHDQAIHELLVENVKSLPFVRAIWIVAADGHMIHDSESLPGRHNLSDRQYFKAHRDDPGTALFVDKPLLSKHGVWFIGVSRRISNADGSFGGVIAAALEPNYLQAFYASIKVGEEGVVALVHTDGTLMLGSPILAARLGEQLQPLPQSVLRARVSEAGTHRGISVVDGVERLYAFRRLPNRPLLMVVGVGTQESLAGWQSSARAYGLASLALVLLIGWLAYLLWRELKQRAQLNRNLSESERSLASAQSLSHVGSWKIDLRSGQARWSDEMYRLFRVDPADGPPAFEHFSDLLHPDDRPTIQEANARLQGGESWIGELRSDPARGPLRHFLARATTVTSATGEVHGLEGVTQDVTEHQQSLDKLRLAARVFEYTSDGIVITDAEARIVTVNPSFERITGYTEAEAIGHNPRMLHSDRHDPDFYKGMWQALHTVGQWRGEIWNRRKNGSVYPEWLSIIAMRDDRGQCTGYVGVFNDLSDIREANQQLEFLTSHDPLTRLPNRTLLNDRLQQAIARSRKSRDPLALLLLNIDRLRRVNDSIGHDAGDALLKEMAARLSAQLSPGDSLARLGSDEFVIVLTSTGDTADIMSAAQRLIEDVARPCLILGHELTVTTSIGISLYPMDGSNANDLLKCADTALSHVKNDGRNSFRFFTSEMNVHAQHWLSIEHQLRRAIENNELLLHFQPQVRLADGRICGSEALIRWQHSELGLIPPIDFISIAEDTGMIVAIGEWVVHAACRQNKAWQDAGLAPMVVAVNVSAVQISAGTLPAIVKRALQETGLAPEYLEMELTETVMLKETELALQQIAMLREIGVQVSLDDFGTGFSSLSYLSRFTLDKLKIDQGFMRNISTDARSAAIVQGTITLAHGLGIKVIAEGVETEDQIAYLRHAGCDEIQGYFISRPVPAEQLVAMIQRGQLLPPNDPAPGNP